MAKVLLDACIPQWLRMELGEAEVVTARHAGLDKLSDSQLLAAIEGHYDVLVTLDNNIAYQQKISGRTFAVIVLRVTDQTPEAFRTLVSALVQAIGAARPGEVRHVS